MLPSGFGFAVRYALLLLIFTIAQLAQAVTITEGHYQGRAHYIVYTQAATYYFDRAGGGFSRLIDAQGKDWIGFKKDPLESFPASAAAGFRGIPNSLFGETNPDSGGGHPGFDRCNSHVLDSTAIRSVTKTGQWQWTWRFTETTATMTMDKAVADLPWWFLYEGTIAGSFAPKQKYWGSNLAGPRRDVPDRGKQVFDHFNWVYFGDINSPTTLYLVQHSEDSKLDNLWYLGSSKKGSAKARDGMVIFGFGRGAKAQPQLQGTGHKFTLGLVGHGQPPVIDGDLHSQISHQVQNALALSPTVEPSVRLYYRSVAAEKLPSLYVNSLLINGLSKNSRPSKLGLLAPHITRFSKPQLQRFLSALHQTPAAISGNLQQQLVLASVNRAFPYAYLVQEFLANLKDH